MKFGYIFSILFGGWILSAHYLQKNLSIYTSDRYYTLILVAGFVSVLIGVIGLIINSKAYRNITGKNVDNNDTSFIESNQYLITFILTLIGGFIFSPILLVFSIFMLGFPQFNLNLNSNFIFALVILTSIIFPTKGISPALATERADEINTVNVQNGVKILNNFAVSTEQYSIGDWAASISYNPDPEFYKGKTVNLEGFVFKPAMLEENEFYIARYSIRCCVADAAPTGIKVKYDIGDEYKIGDWVSVHGVFGIDDSKGYSDIVVIPDTVKPIPIPEKQYIF
jgi:uncharacterized repeat protein (TIGR03943 family)